jgi:hypothetical protein
MWTVEVRLPKRVEVSGGLGLGERMQVVADADPVQHVALAAEQYQQRAFDLLGMSAAFGPIGDGTEIEPRKCSKSSENTTN